MGCGPRTDTSTSVSTAGADTGPSTASTLDPSATASASDTTGVSATVGSASDSSAGTTGTEADSGDEVPECLVLQNYDLGADGECDVVNEGPPGGCTPYNDECPPTQKCNEYQECQSVVAKPRQLYESCMDLGLGLDDCDRGLTCRSGACYANCICSHNQPYCEADDTRCMVNATSTGSCLPTCDLLEPSCPTGAACVAWNYAAVCAPSASQGNGAPGLECPSDGCAAGSVCYGDPAGAQQHLPSRIPGCGDRDDGVLHRCCAEVCRLPDGVCSQAGAVCTAIPLESEFLGCFGDAGVCLSPD
jgi:hypothetical protein